MQRIGADVVSRVADELDGLATFDLAVVHLGLPLAEPSAAHAIEARRHASSSFPLRFVGHAGRVL